MRVFVTGASGFVGSAIVKELLQAGHQVLGLVRSDSTAAALAQTGADVHRGDITDHETVIAGATQCDAIIHTAFNHDFSRFKESSIEDHALILALGATQRPLIVTSAIGVLNYGRPVDENDTPPPSEKVARAATEEAARKVGAYIVRLPPTTHGEGDHGFVPIVINTAKAKGESAYIGDGANTWAAVHRLDAAVLYRLILEKQPEQKVFHAVDEVGVPFKEIAKTIGDGLGLPTVSRTGADAEAHFGWFMHFAGMSVVPSAELTKKMLGWMPKQRGILEDITASYF
ncbi:SDR family oxidoreductase [Chitinophaga sancti]|uniref:Nucleoside-diphosphate-sugar epimerase n=1 Tax=Chitinophaga sancti TaxID=1004 RepID=A0A1K1SNU7_9BACT|nr:SDR family oxidoreductase [Chitinophaga sancti]WQD60071.1 SDR family oxidoreductase [Chitinophaga sancti]WQG87800.1 SDR family oxidoreductase [Chitinophaga sancti]SFW85743.1 Nucleoside-diphosphate-sugar epimerase [Chitinophaga sancti]